MGIFDFLSNIGRDVEGETAEEIEKNINDRMGKHIENLSVSFEDGTVTLSGKADSQIAREKAVLIAGNVKGVEKVNDDQLSAPKPKEIQAPDEPVFYTVEEGDSLSKIAKSVYGDASKWEQLFEANREVINDPDLIYPGQKIRIPDQLDA